VTAQNLTFSTITVEPPQVVKQPRRPELHELGERMVRELETFLADALSRPQWQVERRRLLPSASGPVRPGGLIVLAGTSRSLGAHPC
jgi:hypothetical protein